VLAIEMSQRSGSVALRARPGAEAVEAPVPPSDDRGDHLMDVIDRVCRAVGIGARDLRLIAVSAGPGGFTGLRVACATARAVADAVGAHAVGVPSALVAARTLLSEGRWPHADGARACVLLAAKGSDAWRTTVEVESRMPRVVEAGLVPAGSALSHVAIGDRHAHALWPGIAADAWLEARFSALACLEVGESLVAAGASADPMQLAPIYPRAPEAVTLWERRHGPLAG
jgi:tRNA threonylcarbamoyladenosine biosynthesis protein TsaB